MAISSYQNMGGAIRKPIGKTGSQLANSFSLIEVNGHFRFLIMDCPTDSTISLYLKEFSRLNVTDVVRVCEPTYNSAKLQACGINVMDLPFKDGEAPPPGIIKEWLHLVYQREAEAAKRLEQNPMPTTIAVHCVAGLGRAPALVAVALVDFGRDPVEVIESIRRKRRGAFNKTQITFLVEQYKRSSAGRGRMAAHSKTLGLVTGGANGAAGGGSTNVSPSSSTAANAGGSGGAGSGQKESKSFFKKMFGGGSSH